MISVFFCFRNIAPHNHSISFLLTLLDFHLIVYAGVAETTPEMGETIMKLKYLVTAAAFALAITAGPSFADVEAAKKWIDAEFQPSTLSKDDQLKEMEWFIKAAEPYKGMEINVLSEGIPTHDYESKVLTKAFEEITGIKVNHQILGEGEVVQAVQTQMQTNRNLYDAYVNDSDLIGLPIRLTVSARALKEGSVEFKRRDSKEKSLVPRQQVLAKVKDEIEAMKAAIQAKVITVPFDE